MTIIAFATSAETAGLVPDDHLALPELEHLGIHVRPVVWSDPGVPWETFGGVVVRSCWDYFHRRDEFLAWVDRVERAGIPLWNPPAVVRWNSSKTYLRELAARGVPVVPTRFVEPGDDISLGAILAEERWTDAVVKPVVSAGGHATWRTDPARAAHDEPRFRALAAEHGGMMVQPFVPQVAEHGEWSILFFGGAFSHAVLKQPEEGNFLVQPQHGGSSRAAHAPPELVAQAHRAVSAVGEPLLYARVDGCVVRGQLRLMELEALEPSLFLELDPGAPARFARAIAAAIVHAHGAGGMARQTRSGGTTPIGGARRSSTA